MSAALIAAWSILKRLPWKWIGLALAIGGLLLLLYRAPWAEARGRAAMAAKYQPELDRALRAETVAIGTIGRLRAAIDTQNAATLALAKAEKGKLAEAQAALAVARSHDAARADTIAKLKASAARPLPGPVCEASQATKDAWR